MLTEKQEAVLNHVESCIKKNGYAPTLKEMSEHFGITPMAIKDRLELIEKKGYIERVGNRAIKILKNFE